MNLYECKTYTDDVDYAASLNLPWVKLKDKSIMISGATGLIGSFLIDTIFNANEKYGLNCTVYALGRSEERISRRFRKHVNNPLFKYTKYDVKLPLVTTDLDTVDFVLHLASNTHPLQYSTDPIGTITTNIVGLQNLLEYASNHNTERFLFASSNEIYGENRGDVEFFKEDYCGYIDCNTLRAGYPESKRCGEALCQAYISQRGLDVVISRLTRTYGPTMLKSDTKAISQFIKKAIAGEDIVLKSKGTQYYSYQYVMDSVTGLLTVMLCGKCGEAYNIADENSDIMLKDLAATIADAKGQKVVFELPDEVEAAGYSKATKARLDGQKLKELGWEPKYNIQNGINRTINILCSINDVPNC